MNQSISFIIPAYNCATTIAESVESIFNGNFENGDEVVICNDASTDDTVTVVKRLMKKYPEIKLVEHKFNKGGGAARNTVMENTSNELIFCLDSDNLLVEDSLAKLKKHMLQENADAASFGALKFFESNKNNVVNNWKFAKAYYAIADLLATHVHPGSSGNYLYTKQYWLKAGRYPEYVGSLDAWGFSIKAAFNAFSIAVLQDSHYFNRVGHQSYWMRDAKKLNASPTGLMVLIPYLDKLDPNDVEYLFSPFGRQYWHQNLEKRPIRLNQNQKINTINHLIKMIQKKISK